MMVLVPLFNFNWHGDLFEIKKLGKIQRMQKMPDLSKFKTHLTEFDTDALRDVTHWLIFEQKDNMHLDESEKINIFLLALWIALPTRIQIRIIFKSSENMNTVTRHLDRFQHTISYSLDKINNAVLTKVNNYIDNIMNIYINPKRLYNGLVLNLTGNFSISWHVAFICFSSAMEAILTYSKSGGLTDRLAKSFACLTETEKSKRDIEFTNFKRLYNIRSDIMHGRAMNYDDQKINLKNLNEFEIVLRKIWQTILASKDIIVELEKKDKDRKLFFDKIEKGYQPPKI
jgi:hypothetical protein